MDPNLAIQALQIGRRQAAGGTPSRSDPGRLEPLRGGLICTFRLVGTSPGRCGLKPHSDFARAAGCLGAWDGECELTFGRDGKPMYISGPYDGEKIMRNLHRSLGDRNHDFVHMSPGWTAGAE